MRFVSLIKNRDPLKEVFKEIKIVSITLLATEIKKVKISFLFMKTDSFYY